MAQIKSQELQTALSAYAEQRRMAISLASDYSKISQSRFHGLRLLWSALKTLIGSGSQHQGYAVWSPRLRTTGTLIGNQISRTPSSQEHSGVTALAKTDDEQRLLASWNARTGERGGSPPLVSIVIPVYNKIDVTRHCLQSIADTWFDTIEVQIIVVDDGSTDRTSQVLTQLRGLDYVRNGHNQGFVRACNRGAAIARGKYICFLNNDTEVREAWLDHLVNVAEADPMVGAVGSKLIYPDGTLQEAGSIIWRDSSGWNYGRGEDPRDSRFNYLRDVDYCSGAALMVRRDLFERLGGFSDEFAPAYYEDADLCMAVRSHGYRVVYQPRSEVIHFEGVTSGTDTSSGTKRFQEINKPKFHAKWATALEKHFENSPALVPMASRRLRGGKTILIIDSYVPLYDKDAGSLRLLQIVKMLRESGYHVIFLPDNYAALQPYTAELQALGVEVLHHIDKGRPLQKALDTVLPLLDYAWICRPQLFAKYAKMIRRNAATRVIYDTIDLHFIRARREAELRGQSEANSWQALEQEELAAARAADATIVVSQPERDTLLERGIENVYIVPTLHDAEITTAREFRETSGLLFIGGYNHTPNVDAAEWLCKQIMPLIWKRNPSVHLTLLGSNPPEVVRALAGDRVSVPGYIADVSEHFLKSRVFLAPLRFGAGIKGKVGQALSYRLPIVLTSIAAEGFGFESGRDCLIADNAADFAEATLRLLSEEALWREFSETSARVLEPFGTSVVKVQISSMLRQLKTAATAQA